MLLPTFKYAFLKSQTHFIMYWYEASRRKKHVAQKVTATYKASSNQMQHLLQSKKTTFSNVAINLKNTHVFRQNERLKENMLHICQKCCHSLLSRVSMHCFHYSNCVYLKWTNVSRLCLNKTLTHATSMRLTVPLLKKRDLKGHSFTSERKLH